MDCYYCKMEMTKEDIENCNPQKCCNGRDCACMGLPIDPPCCIKCSKKEN